MPIRCAAIRTKKQGHAKLDAVRLVVQVPGFNRFPGDANLRIQMPERACLRKDVPSYLQPALREMPPVWETRGAADLGRRRRTFQGLRVLRDRLQATGWSVGKGRQYGGESRADPEARREAAQKRLQLRQVTALETIRAALSIAASRLGASDVEVALERPRDPTHGDLATHLALPAAKQLG